MLLWVLHVQCFLGQAIKGYFVSSQGGSFLIPIDVLKLSSGFVANRWLLINYLS